MSWTVPHICHMSVRRRVEGKDVDATGNQMRHPTSSFPCAHDEFSGNMRAVGGVFGLYLDSLFVPM